MPTEDITIEDLVNWYCEYYNIELWKDIPGFEGVYQASNTGKIRSLDRVVRGYHGSIRHLKGKILEQPLDKDGYPVVCLTKKGVRAKNPFVSVIVARTWVPNPLNHPEVNHIDECKTNNNAANLEWCDCKYNINWGTRNTKVSKARTNHKCNSKPVLQYTIDGVLVAEYPSTSEVKRQTGINNSGVARCCRGVVKTAGGYIWKYKEGA